MQSKEARVDNGEGQVNPAGPVALTRHADALFELIDSAFDALGIPAPDKAVAATPPKTEERRAFSPPTLRSQVFPSAIRR